MTTLKFKINFSEVIKSGLSGVCVAAAVLAGSAQSLADEAPQGQALIRSQVPAVVAPAEVPVWKPTGQGLIKTDVSSVLGPEQSYLPETKTFDLEPGHYVIGTERCNERCEFRNLFVEKSVNNDGTYIALMIDNDTLANHRGTGTLYYGTHVRGGTTVQFSPYIKTEDGSLVNSAKVSSSAPVLMVSLRLGAQNERYPFLVIGVHGGREDFQMGMRGSNRRVALVNQPSRNIYQWNDLRHEGLGDVTVQGRSVLINKRGSGNESFVSSALNGRSSSILTLIYADYDVQREEDNRTSRIARIATFMKVDNCDEEVFIVGEPLVGTPKMDLTVYSPESKPNILEILFGKLFHTIGRTAPNDGWFN